MPAIMHLDKSAKLPLYLKHDIIVIRIEIVSRLFCLVTG